MCLSRRDLLVGASAGSLMAAAGPGLRVSLAAAPGGDIVIVLFLRGGSDGLQLVAPAGDPNYIANRPTIRVQATGTNAGLGMGTLDGVDFYFNPLAPELKTLYDAKTLAVVHAAGLPTANRSHFVCMDQMERGVADGDASQNTGWLARHLSSLPGTKPPLGTIASGSNNPVSLLGFPQAVAVPNAEQFDIFGGAANADVIRFINGGATPYQAVATATLDAVASVQEGLETLGTDDTAELGYTNGPLSQSLRSLAKLIKMNVGVSLATVDMGGWDHHDNLVNEFGLRTQELSRSLGAFWKDVAAYQSKITLVTMTEFGRRVKENASAGTDHGSASLMLVMGGSVDGGKLHGDWPGLGPTQLDNGDLAVANDYRKVLLEILVKRHGLTDTTVVFPAVPYQPIGIIAG